MTRGAGALALACALGLAACSRTKAADGKGPFLSVLQPAGATPARSVAGPRSVALALGGLPPGEVPRLREHLARATDEAARRAAPELFDLEEVVDADAGPGPLRPSLPELPALTAAANLLGAPWEAPGVSVHLGPACEPAASRCVALFAAADPADDLVRRGRALAWAAGNAALLRVPAASRVHLAASLREAQRRPSSTIALVFDATRGTLDDAELERLRRDAARSLEELGPGSPRRAWLAALAAAPASWELPFALEPDALLVIPRLSALARLPDFAAEIEGAGAGTFAWVARPGGAPGRAAGRVLAPP